MNLPGTEHYQIVVTEDPEHPNTTIYGVQNIETSVFEYYDNLLPRTYQAMVHTEEKYKDMEDLINGVKPLELVSINSEETEH